jgi:hypothetical protein
VNPFHSLEVKALVGFQAFSASSFDNAGVCCLPQPLGHLNPLVNTLDARFGINNIPTHKCGPQTMPFLFSYVCDLLQRLDDNRLARSGLRSNAAIIQEWFRGHQGLLHRDDYNSAPLLSALLPEKRTDRVYFIREKKLQIIIGRALGLGRSRIAELGRWNNPEARADLADCVESILNQTVTNQS